MTDSDPERSLTVHRKIKAWCGIVPLLHGDDPHGRVTWQIHIWRQVITEPGHSRTWYPAQLLRAR